MRKTIAKLDCKHLLRKEGKYLVALSGGADSVFLTHVLHRLGYAIDAAHCNFHLRGEESDRDEAFCKNLCERLGIALHIVHFDTKTYADLHKVSIEMAARDLRYNYFEQLRKDIGADGICVAHHMEDSVETVLMNIIRGTGLNGLTGISPRNGHILRPMLNVTREEIEQYLDACGEEYVTDSTNLEAVALRNKIRLEVVPLLKTINPSVCEDIAKMSARLAEASKVMDDAMQDAANRVCNDNIIDTGKLLNEVSPEMVLFHILSPYGFQPAQIENISSSLTCLKTGSTWKSDSHELLFNRGSLIIEKINNPETREYKIPETGTYNLGDGLRISVKMVDIDDGFVIPKTSDTVAVDAEKVRFPLTIRHAANGDRFIPFGMKGSKLISDYLTNKKKTLFEKRQQRVITDAEGRVVWLIGERTDNRFRITGQSKKAVILSV